VEFKPFTDEDFDAYLPKKWQSNVFNLERLQVKQKLEALGRFLAPALHAADGSPLACEVSTEHPALWNNRTVKDQHLFFSRNQEGRQELEGIISRQRTMAAHIEDPSPLRNHIFLMVRIDHEGLEVGLKLHHDASVDRENLRTKCQEFFAREKLLALLRQLPEGMTLQLGDAAGVPTATLNDEALVNHIEGLEAPETWLSVTRQLSREDEQVCDDGLADELRGCLTELLPLLHFIGWSRDNDHLAMRKTLKEEEVQRKSKGLSPGDRVRVVSGMFAGKSGVVEEVDARGDLKVRLGNIPMQMNGDAVVKL